MKLQLTTDLNRLAARLIVLLLGVLFAFVVPPAALSQTLSTVSGKSISFEEMDRYLERNRAELQLPGLSIAVINNGAIVYERTLGFANLATQQKVDQDTIFEAASMSKSVFAYLVMKLMQEGILKLDLDQPVYQYFPYPDIAYDDRYKLITARMLLTHTAGFPNWRENGKLTLRFTPGTQYSYSGEGYEYLVNAVAHLTHTDSPGFDRLLQEEVCQPLGLEHFSYLRSDYLTKHKAYGYYSGQNENNGKFNPIPLWFGASHGLHTNTRDYAKFLIGIMKEDCLKKPMVDSLLTPRVRTIEDGKPTSMFYAYGFVVDETKYGTRYQHTGNNGSFTGGFMFFRKPQNGFVLFTNGDKGVLLDLKLAQLLTDGFSSEEKPQ